MGGDVIEYSAVELVGFSVRRRRSVLCNNNALCAAGRADWSHFWKVESAVHARLHDDVDRIVAWLRRCWRCLGFEFGEKSMDTIANPPLKGLEYWGKILLRSRIATEAAVIRGAVIG
jgi:hypothetical protein